MNIQHILRLTTDSARLIAPLRLLSTTNTLCLDQRWREKRGLPANPNAFGTILEKPDYTFIDGRPTPYGSRQKVRIMKNRDIAQKIITLSKEVDFAVDRHKQSFINEEQRKQNIIMNKLKPKGAMLLKTKNDL